MAHVCQIRAPSETPSLNHLPDLFLDQFLLQVFCLLENPELEICKLVCKKWHQIHFKAVQRLKIVKKKVISDLCDSTSALVAFPNLRSVTILDEDEDFLSDIFDQLSTPSIQLTELKCTFFMHRLELDDYVVLFKLIASKVSLESLSLNFFEPVDSIDLSRLDRLKSLTIDGHLLNQASFLTEQQMERMEHLDYKNLSANSRLVQLINSENASCWKNLKSLSLYFRSADSKSLSDSLILLPTLESLGLKSDFSDRIGQRPDLSNLLENMITTLECFYWESFPQWIFRLKNLKSLKFGVNHLDSIHSLFDFAELKHLSLVVRCPSRERVQENENNIQIIQELIKLESLDLQCSNFDVILTRMKNLTHLKEFKLNISNANVCKIKGLSRHPSLHTLSFKSYDIQTVSLDADYHSYIRLSELTWISPPNHPNFIQEDDHLRRVVPDASHLLSLVLNCKGFRHNQIKLIGDVFIRLRHLELFDSDLEEFPDSFNQLKNLTCFKIFGFTRLQSLSFLHNCTLLRILHIIVTPNLSSISESFFGLKFVREIWIVGCPRLFSYRKRFKEMAYSVRS